MKYRVAFYACAIWSLSQLAMAAPGLPNSGAGGAEPKLGECVMFREGGAGLIFKTPTYWLKGHIAGLLREHRLAERCPDIGKPESAFSRADWARVAAALPCVEKNSEVHEVEVLRVEVAVDEWETPWSIQHGTTGWLFRGQFLDQTLQKGGIVDMDGAWLERCAPDS